MYIHMYVYVVCMYTHTYIHVCIYIYIYLFTHIYMYTHTHLNTHTDIGKKYLGCPSGTVARSLSFKEARHDDKRLYHGRCSYGYLATLPRLKCVQRGGEIRKNAPFMSIYIYIHMCVCRYIYMHVCIYIYVCMYIYIYVYIYIYMCIYMYIHIYVYVYIYIHIYKRRVVGCCAMREFHFPA